MGMGRADVSCIFTVNVLQFVPAAQLGELIQGCRHSLRQGGLVFLCGPFFDGGQATETNLVYDEALKNFVKSTSTKQRADRPLSWGLHDAQQVCACAEEAGLEFVMKSTVERDWLAIVLRRPIATTPQRHHRSVRGHLLPMGVGRRSV